MLKMRKIVNGILCLSFVVAAVVHPVETLPTATAQGDVEIWYASSEAIVLQTKAYENKNKNGLTIEMAKNEYESGQIILSAGSKVNAYDVEISDLTCGDATIPVEDISVYMEGYVYNWEEEMSKKSRPNYTSNEYVPDYLLPMDKAVAYGENTVEAGNNQGIYVTVKTNKDTPAGTYMGNFTLTVDGVKHSIPVKVTVWDITVSDEVNTASVFMLYGDRLVNSLEGEATDEKLKLYYDFFLDHRLSLMYLPTTTNDVDQFLDLLKEYYNHPAFSAYEIPYSCKLAFDYDRQIYGYGEPDLNELQDTVNRIVAMSVADGVNYLEKGYVYNIYVDEFLLDSSKSSDKYKQGLAWVERFNAFLEKAVNALDTAYGEEYLDSVEGLRFSLKHLTCLNAGSDVQVGKHIPGETYGYNSVMPEPDAFNNAEMVAQLRSDWSNEGDEIWWYTCVGPLNPYPNYHLSNTYSLLDARLLSWMQYDLEIYGNLYWSVNKWTLGGDAGTRTNVNIYDEQRGFGAGENNGGCYGDGLLIYPGEPYGMDEPVSTMRLESIRDGLEDYAILEAVDGKYQELGEYYGLELDGDATLDTIFAKVFRGTISFKNEQNILSAKSALFETVLGVENDAKILLETAVAEGDNYAASVLVAGDYQVVGNYSSKETCGSGYRYTFNYTRGEDIYLTFTATKGEEVIEYNVLLERAPISIISFETADDIQKVTLTKNSKAEIAQVGNKSAMKVTLASSAAPSEVSTFKPKVEFSADYMKDVLSKANQYTINLYNANDFDVQLVLTASSSTKKTTLRTVTLKANSWNEVTISDTSALGTAVKISFEFENKVGSILPVAINYDIYFSNLAYQVS